jgi:hypothetical protein
MVNLPKLHKLYKRVKPRKQKKQSEFERYLQMLPETDAGRILEFFAEFDSHVAVPKNEKMKIRADFENALLYYNSTGISLDTALARLNIENLGGFYARPPILWYPLDNAAKIYPLSMKHGQMSVFRLSVYLKQSVVPEILQMALTFAIKRFPTFATTVKKGFFWHYLDTAKRKYAIEKESSMPCRPLKISGSNSQSFRVLHYNNRISIEYFHVLTDGAGGMVFLKTLTAEYLRLLGINTCVGDGILNINDSPTQGEAENAFSYAEKTENASGFVDASAVQMSGKISKNSPCRVLHYKMDASCLKAAAKSRNATITAYLLALMFEAGKYATDGHKGNINIQVPVNMRQYYHSDTLRNFSMYCGIKIPLAEITGVDDILDDISAQLVQKASKQSMSEMISSSERMVNAMRRVPLFIKKPAAKAVYGFLGEGIFSNTLSNLGVVAVPPEMKEHIESMDFVLAPSRINRACCSAVTFGNIMTFSITKTTLDPSFEEKLYKLLTEDGITVVAEGTELYED